MPVTVAKPELLKNGSDREFRQFIHDLLAFVVRMNEVRAGYGALMGLSGSGFAMLVSIAHQQGDEGVGINLVAKHLHLSSSFVTIEVGKLISAGLVKKRVNVSDRRRVLLTLTPRARHRMAKLTIVQAPVNAALFDALTVNDFKRLGEMMTKLVPCGDRALALMDHLTNTTPKLSKTRKAPSKSRATSKKKGSRYAAMRP